MSSYDEIAPPSSMTVPAERKVVLYTHDGKELVRPIGFAPTVKPQPMSLTPQK